MVTVSSVSDAKAELSRNSRVLGFCFKVRKMELHPGVESDHAVSSLIIPTSSNTGGFLPQPFLIHTHVRCVGHLKLTHLQVFKSSCFLCMVMDLLY